MTRKHAITYSLLAVVVLSAAGCSSMSGKPGGNDLVASEESDPTHRLAALVNRVWTVRASNTVATGTLYVFLEDGTLLITSSYSEPALGQWQLQSGNLVLVEQGIRYPTEVLTVNPEELRLVVHSPGEPVHITLSSANEVRVH